MPLNLESLTDIDAATQLRKQLLNKQLMHTMGQDALLGLGIGGAVVGTTGLAKLMLNALKRRRSAQQPVQAPVLHVKQRPQQSTAEKMAAMESVLNAAASGRAATHVNALPYGLSGRALALLLGLGGGAMLTNKLMSGANQHSLDSELEDARAEFEAALSGNKNKPTMKLAAAFTRLEKAAEAFTQDPKVQKLDKQALTGMSEGMGELMGLYTLMALLAGGTAGYYGYQGGVKNQKAKKYELAHAARQQRQRRLDPTRPVAVLDQEELTSGF